MLSDLGEFVKAPSSGIEPPVVKRFEDKHGAELSARLEQAAAKKAAKKAPAKPAPKAPAAAATEASQAPQAPAAATAEAPPAAPVEAPAAVTEAPGPRATPGPR